jgi:hypothetical protein
LSRVLIERHPSAVDLGARKSAPFLQFWASMPLTDTQADKASPGEKDYKLADSGGL